MPAIQTNYLDNIVAGFAGQVANQIPATFISRTAETVAGIGFGLAVAQGTADNGCKLFETGDTEILGISVRERSLDANSPDEFAQYADVRVMTKGAIYVNAAVAVNAGDSVYVTAASGAFGNASGAGIVQIPNARWDTSTSGAGLAIVRLG